MSCTNCFNNCTEIKTDQCIKYTGLSISALGINNGDSLLVVENAIITYLTSVLTGVGVIITIPPEDLCTLVSQYLPAEGDITLVDVLSALVQAACDLQGQIDSIEADLTALEANYTIGCLEGVSANSGTHAILQAAITKLCTLNTSVAALA